MSRKHGHNFRNVQHLATVDAFRVCAMFRVDDPSGATQQAVRLLLLPGQRREQDLREAIDTLTRRLEMLREDEIADLPRPTPEMIAELERQFGEPLEQIWANAGPLGPLAMARALGVRHGPDGQPFNSLFDAPISPLKAIQALIKAVPEHDWSLEIERALKPAACIEPADPKTERLAARMQEIVDWLNDNGCPDAPNSFIFDMLSAHFKIQRSRAVRDVLAERRRQIESEGWSLEHDDGHVLGQLAAAAGCYLHAAKQQLSGNPDVRVSASAWPWDQRFWKPGDVRRNLIKAVALALAEIEREDREADRKEAAAEAHIDIVGRNGLYFLARGSHDEQLPEGLSWELAPDWAVALVTGEPGEDGECLFVWVPGIGAYVEGQLARPFRGRNAGSAQGCDMETAGNVWRVIATRPGLTEALP